MRETPNPDPGFDVDHVFVAAASGAPEVEQLVDAGFAEGPPNTHPGQGTACRRIFFENGYLELAWLEDAEAASAPPVDATALARRTGGSRGASRIGVCLRARGGAAGELPVATWDYRPAYMPPGVAIPMAVNSSLGHEPLLFFFPADLTPPSRPGPTHPNGARAITGVRITVKGGREPSAELAWLAGSGSVHVESGTEESVALELDGGARGRRLRVSTPSPLHLTW